MAQPTTISAAKITIWVEDSNSPNSFIAPCGLNTKGINFSASTNDVTVPDCDDPDLPSWTQRVVEALSASISGSGVLAMESLELWREFYEGAIAVTCRVMLDNAAGGFWYGEFLLTTFNVTGTIGNKVQVEVAMESDGAVTWTPA